MRITTCRPFKPSRRCFPTVLGCECSLLHADIGSHSPFIPLTCHPCCLSTSLDHRIPRFRGVFRGAIRSAWYTGVYRFCCYAVANCVEGVSLDSQARAGVSLARGAKVGMLAFYLHVFLYFFGVAKAGESSTKRT
ncbi:hypothetical protein DFH11DRAFT_1629359 [Phellopilus nigrolimitatus]|nr:hypothetical protein DFH11DRAFT_1629359 [Phellopilus nigrolimitatus]